VSLAGKESQSDCPYGTSYSISSAVGSTGALSASIDVEVLNPPLNNNSWGPIALWNLKYRLSGLSGCLFAGSTLSHFLNPTVEPTIEPTILPGITWNGFFELTPVTCEPPAEPAPDHAAVSLQLINGSVLLLLPFNHAFE
jgi:hypothetical protein